MQDRVPLYPGRVTLTPVAGQANTYDMARADQPTQEGTPLNKANLLSDQVATLIGLNTSAVPNDMFNVLATAGDLHVWRRTVTTQDGIPAGYTLGEEEGAVYLYTFDTGVTAGIHVYYSDSLSVDDAGNVSLVSSSSFSFSPNDFTLAGFNGTLGKYIWITDTPYATTRSGIWYIPQDAIFYKQEGQGGYVRVSKAQPVTGYPAVPPGTYTDYPVSVYPNAYQAGSDEQPAGYTLEDVQSGYFVLSNQSNSGWAMSWNYSNSVSVTEDGVVSLSNPASTTITGNMSSQAAQAAAALIKGKFVSCTGSQSYFQANTIYFIPSDAVITSTGSQVWIDKYQPVTGYPAIPAGTTIGYLGKLGDKARIVTGSYVGTGTYGSGSPNSIPFDGIPRAVLIYGWKQQTLPVFSDFSYMVVIGDNDRTGLNPVVWSYGSLSWYSTGNATQMNSSGVTYQYKIIY